MTEAKTIMSPPEHTFICDVEDKEPAKGKAFSVKVMVTPAVTFDDGNAKSVAFEPVKTEGSTVASAAVASLITVDKVSGFVACCGCRNKQVPLRKMQRRGRGNRT